MLKKCAKLFLSGAMMVAFIGTTISAVNAAAGDNARAIPDSQTSSELIGGDLQTDATCVSHINSYGYYITLGGWSITPNDCYASSKNAEVVNSTSVYFTGSFYKGSLKGNLVDAYHHY